MCDAIRVAVVGSRSCNSYNLVKSMLLAIFEDLTKLEIVCGMARGADMMGLKFAKEFKLPVHKFPANWNELGKKAGVLRNKDMADFSDVVVAFWDGESKGTSHMIDYCLKNNKTLYVFNC